MCGICGILTTDEAARHTPFVESVEHMKRLMQRRGPDGSGTWCDPDGHLILGFQRLAIIDLSDKAMQPMASANEQSVLVFNGELYNFRELRRELEAAGVHFRSRSDSEVVLEALNHWGIAALDRFNGMFALAWYERRKRELLLVRDHAGVKPLYYYQHPARKGVAFASQFNCLLHTPWGTPGDLRLDALHLYLRLQHLPPPFTLFENVFQLEPGHYLLVRADGSISKRAWWALPRDPEPAYDFADGVEALQGALHNAVERQRIADVPLGVFLSGGVDSPLVAAEARQQTDGSLKAFTIGNPGWWQDEAEAASVYAQLLDVEHHLHNISGIDAAHVVDRVAAAQTEPFGDFSIIPTLLVSEAARTELTVALSGDGGDELFWGYERPLSLLRNGRDFQWPWLVRLGLYAAGKYGIGPRRSGAIVHRTPGDYYFEVNSRLAGSDLASIAPELPPLPASFDLYAFDGYRGMRHLANYSRWVEFYGQLQRGLKKVDMASMYHSLEVRVPLLDREVIEVSLKLDPAAAMQNGTRKATLRALLGRYVPPEVIPEPKRGFAVPLADWLRGPLRPLVEETLIARELFPGGVFSQQGLSNYWQQHLTGEKDHKWGLWTILSLQWWAQTHLRDLKAG